MLSLDSTHLSRPSTMATFSTSPPHFPGIHLRYGSAIAHWQLQKLAKRLGCVSVWKYHRFLGRFCIRLRLVPFFSRHHFDDYHSHEAAILKHRRSMLIAEGNTFTYNPGIIRCRLELRESLLYVLNLPYICLTSYYCLDPKREAYNWWPYVSAAELRGLNF